MDFAVRLATPDDAAGIRAVLDAVVAERVHTAIAEPWPVEEQRRYLASLSRREAFHVAVDGDRRVIGYQSLDLYSAILPSMSHVGQIGTFLHPEWRGRGAGTALYARTLAFARENGYAKFAIQVRGSNAAAQRFYVELGFAVCGRLSRQVRIADAEDDEVLMEFFL